MLDARVRGLLLAALASASPSVFADVLFSEYVEGSSYNKAVEIHNAGSESVDLGAAGYRIELYSNGSVDITSAEDLSGTLAAGETLVVCNSGADGAILDVCGLLSGTVNFNGDDAFVLRSGGESGAIVDAIGQIGVDPGSEWGSGDTSTADNTLRRLPSLTSGDSDASDAFDPSVEWAGFAQNSFDGLGCPGVDACEGGETPEASALRIFEIQGAAHLSAVDGILVVTQGIVSAVGGSGFYLQDPQGDDDLATSDGIYVYTAAAPGVAVGDAVTVTGTVDEYRPGGNSSGNLSITELTSPRVVAGSALFDGMAVTPTVLGAAGRLPPNTIIDDDTEGSVEVASETTYDPEQDGIDFYESLEGMLVHIDDALVIAPTNQYGEVWVVADGGEGASGINARGGLTQTDNGEGVVDYNPERIQIDAGLGIEPPADAQPGDRIASVDGVFSYGFGYFEVLATALGEISPGTLERETTTLSADFGGLTIGSYNVENLDPNDDDPNPGASGCPDADIADGKFAAIADQIVTHLGAPDILALQEVQDNSGCTDDGVVAGDETLATLSVAIADAGGPDYSYIEITPVDGQDGGLPGGNIRVAYLYDASRVSLVDGVQGAGDSTTGTEATEDAGALALSLSPGRVDPGNEAWASTRKPLAGLFDFKGQRLLLINNHWSSKGGSGYQFGAEQPFENGGQSGREAQAQVVNDFVDSVLAVDGNAQIVVVGDLNEFSFLPPLSILRGGDTPVLFDLIDELLAPQERYSYVFDGNSQTLDHALVSEALLDRTEFDVVHVNAQFVDQISDHDPTLMRISFDAEPDDFDFGAVPNAQAGAQVTSPSLALSGFELSLPLEVSGGQYSLNGNAFSTASATAQAGDHVQLRAIASSTPGETRTVTLNLGDSSGSFELTTAAADEGDEDQDDDDDDDDDDGGGLGWGMLALLGFAVAGRQRRPRV